MKLKSLCIKGLWRSLGMLVWCWLGMQAGYAASDSERGKPVIQVIDSLKIDLSKMDSTICIDDQVVISFANDSVFACEWIDDETGEIISQEKVITLQPRTTHRYRVNLYYFTGELIEGGDFESGKNFYTEYKEGEKERGSQWWLNPPKWGWIPELYKEGTYKIGKTPSDYHFSFSTITDHTTGKGNMLMINGATSKNMVAWRTTVKNIEKNKIYAFSAWGSAIGRNNPATFHFTINGKTLGTPHTLKNLEELSQGVWEQFYQLWEADREVAEIALVNLETKGDGNDFALDDISFASMEKKIGWITVKVLPAVELGKLSDLEKCEGEEMSVNAKATGSGINGYSWYKDGNILPETGSLLQMAQVGLEDAGVYACSVSGECGTRKETFRLDVREQLKVAVERDTVHPCELEKVTLQAAAEGYQLAWQWDKPLKSKGWTGGDGPEYSNREIHWGRDTGLYTCLISSRCGTRKVYRWLEAGEKIRITGWPEDQVVCSGSEVQFSVATNIPAASVVWRGGQIDKWEERQTLELKQVSQKDQGIYHCMVVDHCMEAADSTVVLEVVPAMTRVEISRDTAVCMNGKAVFRAWADGIRPRYVWKGPGGFEAEGEKIEIDPVGVEQCGTYSLTVTDSCGNVLQEQVELALLKEYQDIQITPQQEVCPGTTVRLEVTGGQEGMRYEWTTPGGQKYSGAAIQLVAVEAGEYLCRIEGVCEAVEKISRLVLKPPLEARTGETYFLKCPGEEASLEAEATGANIRYEWWKEGQRLGEGKSWKLSNLIAADAGSYECRIDSDCGDTILYYTLQLKEPVKIVNYIAEKSVLPGEKFSLEIQVRGDSERRYVWLENRKELPGEEGNRLLLTAPGVDTTLTYVARVMGCNVDTAVFQVSVNNYKTLTSDTVVWLCEGKNYAYRIRLEDDCDGGEYSMYWLDSKGDTLSRGDALMFTDFKPEQVGEYTWHLETACGDKMLRLEVKAYEKPQITAIHCRQYEEKGGRLAVCAGENVLLEAEIRTTDVVIYEWSWEGRVLPGQTEAFLLLENVSAATAGRYSCRVISGICGEDIRDIQVEVHQPLTVSALTEVTACPGQEVQLKIETSADLPSEFIWEGPFPQQWTATSDGYTTGYHHPAVGAEADGLYSCRVINLCGRDTVAIRVKVEQEIMLAEPLRRDTVCAGTAVTIEAGKELSGMKCTWTLPNHTVVQQESISVPHFSLADTGVYRCHLETPQGCFKQEGERHLYLRPELAELRVSADTSVCEGGRAELTAFADGKEVSYEWRGPQGLLVYGASVGIDPVKEIHTGIYEVVATDICRNTLRRAKVKLSLLKEFGSLSIQGDTVACAGENIRWEVTGGEENMSYEWQQGEQVLGRHASLSLVGVGKAEAGKYTCRVTGRCGVWERKLNLKVYDWLRAEKLPVPEVCEREDVVLAVLAEGVQVEYRWRKEKEEKGKRTAELVLKDVIPADAGIYECEVTSLCGDTLLSYDFQLKEKTRITLHSSDRILCEDDDYKLMVEAEGKNNHYSWYCDGELLPEDAAIITCPAVGYADTLFYRCIVWGDCGVDSMEMKIQVGEFRKVRRDMKDTLCEGSNYKYNVTAIPSGTFEGQGFIYRWTKDSKVLYEGMSSVFPLSEVGPGQAGDYYCEITTLPGVPNANTLTVKLSIKVIRLPRIVSISPDLYAVEGSRDSIRVEALGEELSYTWTKDGVSLPETNPVVIFTPVKEKDRGRYQVTVANRCSRASAFSEVEVWHKTVIVFPQERDDQVCQGDDRDLEVEAWGDNLLYEWYLDGRLLDVPLTQPLVLKDAGMEDAGQYICVVKGRGGLDSCKINLKVMALPEVEIQGKVRLCQEEADLTQVYTGSSNEMRTEYRWSAVAGEIVSGENWKEAVVGWRKGEEGRLALEVVSTQTGCSQKKEIVIAYYPVPEVYLSLPEEVGYCRDTLKLEGAYPWGGIFRVNGMQTEVVRFTDKTIPYEVEYCYTDGETGCHATALETVVVAAAPVLQLAADTIVSGWCAPVTVRVERASEGQLVWEEVPPGSVSGEKQVVYQAARYSDEILKFYASLTDAYQCRTADSSAVVLLPSPGVKLTEDTVVGICNTVVLSGEYDRSVVKVEWEPAEQLQVLPPQQAAVVKMEEGKNEYRITVTDSYGCTGRDTVRVTVVGAPSVPGREICAGDSVVVTTEGYQAYRWEDGYEAISRVMKKPGNYRLEVEDEYGCTAEAEFSVHPVPEVHLQDTLIYEGQQVEFRIEEGEYGPYHISWQDGQTGYTYTADQEGSYSVVVQDNIGCTSGDTARVEVKKWYIAAPDAFLPKSGGENSRFYLKEVNFGSRFEMYIYDRWGELLYKTQEIGFRGGWDGTFKGLDCQPGAYVWVAYVDGKEVAKGTFVLVK